MSSNRTKKRRVAAEGGDKSSTVDGAESAQDVHNELIAMKSTMNELLDHTRAYSCPDREHNKYDEVNE